MFSIRFIFIESVLSFSQILFVFNVGEVEYVEGCRHVWQK
jgi:hypothetical protein